jgi:hypothetical protein
MFPSESEGSLEYPAKDRRPSHGRTLPLHWLEVLVDHDRAYVRVGQDKR